MPEDPPTPLWKLILEQFQDQLVIILLIAAAISFVLAYLESGEAGHDQHVSAYVEPIVILLILIANATVGVIQETNAEKAIDALKEYSPDEARVVREGVVQKVEARDLVPGDMIHLSVGDKIPADCRLLKISSSSFSVDQSILTGESVSVMKDADAIVKDTKAVKQDQINILFSGTTITIGKADAIVVLTGSSTAIGHIHSSITSQIDEKTPLKQALDDFGDQLAKIISVICILVWLINIRHFNDSVFGGNWIKGAIYYFKIAVALAVAAIPEGLAVIITTCLALGTKRMATQGAIVRKLRSVETLGCTSVICSDKTGTLTTNQMSVRRVMTLNGKSEAGELLIEGATYGPEGRVLSKGKPVDRDLLAKDSVLNELSHICSLCNDAKVIFDETNEVFSKVGEPTEAALKTLVEKLGTDNPDLNKQIPFIENSDALDSMTRKEKMHRVGVVSDYIDSKYKSIATFEFSRDRKSMSTLVERTEGGSSSGRTTRASANVASQVLYVKGAPEAIIERCSHARINGQTVEMTNAMRDTIINKVFDWAEAEALRVLAFATVDKPNIPAKVDPTKYASYEVRSFTLKFTRLII